MHVTARHGLLTMVALALVGRRLRCNACPHPESATGGAQKKQVSAGRRHCTPWQTCCPLIAWRFPGLMQVDPGFAMYMKEVEKYKAQSCKEYTGCAIVK